LGSPESNSAVVPHLTELWLRHGVDPGVLGARVFVSSSRGVAEREICPWAISKYFGD
jgi:hypothetical protein